MLGVIYFSSYCFSKIVIYLIVQHKRYLDKLNEKSGNQYSIDFRTGYSTAIVSRAVSESIRSACTALNRSRAGGILESTKVSSPGEQVSPDVWAASFEGIARSWHVPLIPLEKLGFERDEDGFLKSHYLSPLPSGAEAYPFHDEEYGVVYKLFDLRPNGSLGKKLALVYDEDGELDVQLKDATVFDTLEKLMVLNDTGGLISEIVGLADSGDYLISKQPFANPRGDFESDREYALHEIKAIPPIGVTLRNRVAVIWLEGRSWLLGDLHERNIMRTIDDEPTIIDALIGPIPPLVLKESSWLALAVEDARVYRESGQPPLRKAFEDVEDSEL